ncbi:MAG: hypothetical protein WCS47_05340 [Thermovirgaceae bacterium]|jgi:hypothetical protein|nr:hypothetical protein [Synergistales bacterium]NLV64996.1 hypothetical protein [Synergistaceae bacterium]HRW87035.1 hypothetical protein [Thermovirgaceae bacterium]MDD5514762.1 hypothetical protein [Synergistales bacterium]HOI81799.1 hypothetical protein [Synergistales bacterium]
MEISSVMKRAEIEFDVVVLLVAALVMLVAGTLLLPVSKGALPYYENGLYGLLLFIFALQMVTLGRTPFGDAPRSRGLMAAGVIIASLGIITCFIPDIFSRVPRIILSICFGPGGAALLLQMIFSRDKLPKWRQYGGIFHHLIAGCSAVYVLSALIGLLVFRQDLISTPMSAMVALMTGLSLFYLATTLQRIYRAYPEAVQEPKGSVDLPIGSAMILLTGIFMVILGVLLVPVSLGRLPFSGSAQLGLLMVILALQMLATGNSPIGPFPRTWLMIIIGSLFILLGAVSCIIPGVLVPSLTVLIGVLNILGGGLMLKRIFTPIIGGSGRGGGPVPAILVRLNLVQVTMNVVSIMFGTSMLVHNLIPGLVVGVILAANGGLLLYLMRIMSVIDGIQKKMER